MSEQRTRQQVDQDYTQAAIMLGHKYRVLAQIKADSERVQKEIDAHLAKLLELNAEGMALPPEPIKSVEPEVVA